MEASSLGGWVGEGRGDWSHSGVLTVTVNIMVTGPLAITITVTVAPAVPMTLMVTEAVTVTD